MESVYNATTVKRDGIGKRTAFFNSCFWEYAFPFIVGPLTAIDFCCSMIISGKIRTDMPDTPLPGISMPITAFVTMGLLTTCALIYNRLDNVVKRETVMGCIVLTALTVFVDVSYLVVGAVHHFIGATPGGFVFMQVNIAFSVLRCLLIARTYSYVYNVEGTTHPISLTAGGAFAGVALSMISLLATSFWGTLMYVNGAAALLRTVSISGLVIKYLMVREAHLDTASTRILYAEVQYRDPFEPCNNDSDIECLNVQDSSSKKRSNKYCDPSPDFKTVLPIIAAVFLLATVSYCMYPQVIYEVVPLQMDRPTFASLASFVAPNVGHLLGAMLSLIVPVYVARSSCFPAIAFGRSAFFVVFVMMANYVPGVERKVFPLLVVNDWAFIAGVFGMYMISGCMTMMSFNGIYDMPRRYSVYVVSVINVGTVLGICASTVLPYLI